jgi:hypothetical protein
MTPDEILEIDAERNRPKGVTAGRLRAAINQDHQQGGQLVRQGDTLVAFRATAKGVVTFQYFNAAPPAELLKNIEATMQMLKKVGAKSAQMTYKHPEAVDLFKRLAKSFDVSIDEQTGTKTATVRL